MKITYANYEIQSGDYVKVKRKNKKSFKAIITIYKCDEHGTYPIFNKYSDLSESVVEIDLCEKEIEYLKIIDRD